VRHCCRSDSPPGSRLRHRIFFFRSRSSTFRDRLDLSFCSTPANCNNELLGGLNIGIDLSKRILILQLRRRQAASGMSGNYPRDSASCRRRRTSCFVELEIREGGTPLCRHEDVVRHWLQKNRLTLCTPQTCDATRGVQRPLCSDPSHAAIKFSVPRLCPRDGVFFNTQAILHLRGRCGPIRCRRLTLTMTDYGLVVAQAEPAEGRPAVAKSLSRPASIKASRFTRAAS